MKLFSAIVAMLVCFLPAGAMAQDSQPGDQSPAPAYQPEPEQQPIEPVQPDAAQQAPAQNQGGGYDTGRRRFDLPPGITPRTAASAYPASRTLPQFAIGAELLSPKQVEEKFTTPLGKHCLVVEVGVFPGASQSVDLYSGYFTLRSTDPKDEQVLIAATPQDVITSLNAARSHRNVAVLPGMIVIGPAARGMNRPASQRDSRVMEQELREKSLPEGTLTQPSAGYLYFPISGKRAAHYNLELTRNGQTESLPLPEPKK